MHRFTLSALARATGLRSAGLTAALFIPLCSDALAHVQPEPIQAAQNQIVMTGNFLNLAALNNNTRTGGEVATELLRQQTGLSIRNLIPSPTDQYADMQVMVGKTILLKRSQPVEDDAIIASRPDGSFIALMPQANAIIRGTADGQQTLLRFTGAMPNEHAHDSVDEPQDAQPSQRLSRTGQLSYQVDRSRLGEIVIDLLAGFSNKSAEFIGDPEAYALTQVVAVNRSLKQSLVEGVRLRLVGVQIVPNDMPITTSSLKQVRSMFAQGIRQYSPDLVASFVSGIPDQDTAVGWGNVNGRYSINYINRPIVFRHEVAHNIGGHHCSDGSSYRFGYSNGRVKTILCGNQVPYYSNPDVLDTQGVPLGDARTANMARVWRENAAKASAYAPAVVPLEDEQPTSLLHTTLDLAKNQVRHFTLDVPAGTQRLLLSTMQGPLNESMNKVQFLLKKGSQPSSSDYDYRSRLSGNAVLSVDNPQAGRWYLALQGEPNKAFINMVVDGQAYAQKNETVQARYVRLVANSSIDGSPTASIAELHLADAHGKSLPRNWQIHSASSTMSGAAASNIFDGSTATFWASANGTSYPHQLVIDLGQETRFSQLHYLPRQDKSMNGNIKAYQVFAGASADGPWTLLSSGEFSADDEVKSASLSPMETVLPPTAVIHGAKEANAGQQVTLDASASTDPKGHALDFTWKASPNVDFSIDGPLLNFIAPKLNTDTRYRFTLKLSNGKQTSTTSHDVLVKASATATSCSAPWDAKKSYSENDLVQHKGRLYMARWWIKGSEPGNPAVTGADGSGKVWKDMGPCENSTAPALPIAKISGVTSAKAGQQVTLNASGSSEPTGQPLQYRWSVSPNLSFKATGPELSFIAPKASQNTSYRFKLELSNGKQSVFKEHTVTVSAETGEQPSGCQTPWSAKTAYQGGNKVSHKGHIYTARWWTQGNEPGNPSFTGGEGSGRVWNDEGACS
ncbi:discoidin domain-containing protein [Pseudomonas sp. TTU2014-080ASC]|uniref:discoidin domain-containing protein n=1 Tax=Pseudomonas sp. TTU2014-080ASC TaxID=1729724 RepID=UPI0007183A73|nr:discoidin domain-containing protein [Pseudomonas sp. TTU2014-080ASC]KRW59325.1 carbohydrate-binding family V/XII protein [Pseudomonas sp. TTU2014-080ASC]